MTPTILVIFGATGDLSEKKLIPALFDLYTKKFLPKQFRIVGFSRGAYSDDNFRAFAKSAILQKSQRHPKRVVDVFLNYLHYQQGTFEDGEAYRGAAEFLSRLDEGFRACSNKLFYLAVAPGAYKMIFQNIAKSGLTVPCGGNQGWTRVLVEKPFGRDLKTAEELDTMLGELFQEEQIFRIDHYLAKETLQNILAFRFSNALFEPIWNSAYVEKVEIAFLEKGGIGRRGASYDGIGALRDVGQNHVLQMLALIAMEHPGKWEADAIRRERAAVLASLQPTPPTAIGTFVKRGQYKGYQKEKNVLSGSKTETYFHLTAHIANARWRGTPFYLEAGKKMKENKVEIVVYFRKAACLCPPAREQHHQNIVTFRVQPDEGIEVVFWAKRPGFDIELEKKKLSFAYKDSKEELRLPDAYERVLYDCIRGDQTLFTSTEEVEAAWKFITPILENWGTIPLRRYD